jgi:hypothetical protein
MADADKSPVKGISHDEVVRILKKRHKKTAGDLDLIDEKFDSVKFFQEYKQKLDTENFQKLLKQLEYEKVSKNQILFRKGQRGDKFYIILTGSVKVYIHKPIEEKKKLSKNEKATLRRFLDEEDPYDSAYVTKARLQRATMNFTHEALGLFVIFFPLTIMVRSQTNLAGNFNHLLLTRNQIYRRWAKRRPNRTDLS